MVGVGGCEGRYYGGTRRRSGDGAAAIRSAPVGTETLEATRSGDDAAAATATQHRATATATLEATATTDLEPLLGHPEELVVTVEVHAEPFRILADLVLGRHVVGVDLLLEHDRIGGRLHGHGESGRSTADKVRACAAGLESESAGAHTSWLAEFGEPGSPGLFTAPGSSARRARRCRIKRVTTRYRPLRGGRHAWQTDARCGNWGKPPLCGGLAATPGSNFVACQCSSHTVPLLYCTVP